MKDMIIPAVSGVPVLGNLLEFRHDRLGLLERVNQECGRIGSFRLAYRQVVVLNDAEDVYAVLVREADSVEQVNSIRRTLYPLLGEGLLIARNTTHRAQRKRIAPMFQPRRIEHYVPMMVTMTRRRLDTWGEQTTRDVAQEMTQLALHIVAKTLFGFDFASDEANQLSAALTIVLRHINTQWNNRLPIPTGWPTPANQRFQRALAQLDAIAYRIIEERRQAPVEHDDLLSLILGVEDEAGRRLTPKQVRDEVMTLLLAGHETTANALSWTWYLLGQHPDVTTRIRQEVDAILQGQPLTIADIPRLTYTDCVFKEALRLYPPTYVLTRRTVKAIKLPSGYALPADTRVVISPYTLHRNPDCWPEPERFDPDRFRSDNQRQERRCAYIPFGSGPRSCIGSHFATMEAVIVLATITQHIEFELVPHQQVRPEPLLTLRPNRSINVKVHRR